MTDRLINHVPADEYGLWCQHGHLLLIPDPADTSDHPACIPAEPWPCDTCTLAQLEAEMEAEALAYEQARWAEYRATCY